MKSICSLLILIACFLGGVSCSRFSNQVQIPFHGSNFYGIGYFNGLILKMDILQFKRGGIFSVEIQKGKTDAQFQKFFIFKNINELFDELRINTAMEITQSHSLMIPIKIQYRGRSFTSTVSIALNVRRFRNQGERILFIYILARKIQKQKGHEGQLVPRQLYFRGDMTNPNYNEFRVDNEYRIQKINKNELTIYNYKESLPSKGVYYYQVKIVQSMYRFIMIGLCSKDIKGRTSSHAFSSPQFIGVNLSNGYLFANGIASQMIQNLYPQIINGQTIIKVTIDMNNKYVIWSMPGNMLYRTSINKNLWEKELYPMITLYSIGDIIQFVSS